MKKILLFTLIGLLCFNYAMAEVAGLAKVELIIHNIWILIATAFVFLMHLGFASLEAGLTRSKNTVNILFKNIGVISIGIVTYSLFGFNLMYPGSEFAAQWFGFSGFGLSPSAETLTLEYNANYTFWTDFIFQAMFAATAATIVSGAVAERMKLHTFLMYTFLLVGFCYPIVGMWKWGGGALQSLKTPFYDFAGSTIVHSVGGWAALVIVLFLGARIGKYENGKIYQIKPHSFSLVAIGVLLLWFGWYGFNGGSVLSADPLSVSLVFVTTTIGAAVGALSAMILSWIDSKRPDLAMTLNGVLGGLVSITAGADQFSPLDAAIISAIAGALIVLVVKLLDHFKIDDPVGAIPVHLVCGVWGTVAVGLFGNLASVDQFISQIIGVVTVGLFCSAFCLIAAVVLKAIFGVRVSKHHEEAGLDKSEHQEISYWIDTTY